MVTAMLSLTYFVFLFPVFHSAFCLFICVVVVSFSHPASSTTLSAQLRCLSLLSPNPFPASAQPTAVFNAQAYPGPKDMEGPMIKVTGRKKIMLNFCGVLSCRGGAGVNILKNHCDW